MELFDFLKVVTAAAGLSVLALVVYVWRSVRRAKKHAAMLNDFEVALDKLAEARDEVRREHPDGFLYPEEIGYVPAFHKFPPEELMTRCGRFRTPRITDKDRKFLSGCGIRW